MNKRSTQIIAVGGGKGGVGKTLFSTSLSVILAEMGYDVVLVDADLGGSNVHTVFELEPESDYSTITRYFRVKGTLLENVLVPTDMGNLKLLCGSLHNYRLVNLPYFSKIRFFNELRRSSHDVVVIDLGSGSAYTTLDFFAFSDIGIMVTTSEKTSIENMYRFLKGAFLRKLRFELSKFGREIVDEVLHNPDVRSNPKPMEVVRTIESLYPQYGSSLRQFMSALKIGFVLNMVEESDEIRLGKQIELAVKNYMQVDSQYIGYIRYNIEIKRLMKMGYGIRRLWQINSLKMDVKGIFNYLSKWLTRVK